MKKRVSIDPSICHGKPVIRGTRVIVSVILGAMANGDSIETILEDYPSLVLEDVHAALDFGREMASFETYSYDAVA